MKKLLTTFARILSVIGLLISIATVGHHIVVNPHLTQAQVLIHYWPGYLATLGLVVVAWGLVLVSRQMWYEEFRVRHEEQRERVMKEIGNKSPGSGRGDC